MSEFYQKEFALHFFCYHFPDRFRAHPFYNSKGYHYNEIKSTVDLFGDGLQNWIEEVEQIELTVNRSGINNFFNLLEDHLDIINEELNKRAFKNTIESWSIGELDDIAINKYIQFVLGFRDIFLQEAKKFQVLYLKNRFGSDAKTTNENNNLNDHVKPLWTKGEKILWKGSREEFAKVFGPLYRDNKLGLISDSSSLSRDGIAQLLGEHFAIKNQKKKGQYVLISSLKAEFKKEEKESPSRKKRNL